MMLEHPAAGLLLELENAARLAAMQRQTEIARQLELAWPSILDDVRGLLVAPRT